jgi:DNA-binding GntR family transcriptional regulator
VTFLRRLKNRPLCVFTCFFPPVLESDIRAWPFLEAGKKWTREEVDLVEHLDDRLRHPIVEAEQIVNAFPAGRDVVDLLQVKDGDPILRVERIYFTADDRPVAFTVSSFTRELYSYRVSLRRDQV